MAEVILDKVIAENGNLKTILIEAVKEINIKEVVTNVQALQDFYNIGLLCKRSNIGCKEFKKKLAEVNAVFALLKKNTKAKAKVMEGKPKALSLAELNKIDPDIITDDEGEEEEKSPSPKKKINDEFEDAKERAKAVIKLYDNNNN